MNTPDEALTPHPSRAEVFATLDALQLLLDGASVAVFHPADYWKMFRPFGRDVFMIETDQECLAQGIMGTFYGTEVRTSPDMPLRTVTLTRNGIDETVVLFPEPIVHPSFASWAQALRTAYDAGLRVAKHDDAKARCIGIRAGNTVHHVPLVKLKDAQGEGFPDSPITVAQWRAYTTSWNPEALFR